MRFIVLRTNLDHLTNLDMAICFKNKTKKASGKWIISEREHEII